MTVMKSVRRARVQITERQAQQGPGQEHRMSKCPVNYKIPARAKFLKFHVKTAGLCPYS